MIEPTDEEYYAITHHDENFLVRLYRSMTVLPPVRASPRPWSIVTVLVIAAAALMSGAASGGYISHCKNMHDLGIFPILVIVLTLSLPLAFSFVHRLQVTAQAVLAVTIEAFASWIGVAIGYALVTDRGGFFRPSLEVTLCYGLMISSLNAATLAFIHWRNHPRLIIGPYCPACRYHLVGVSKHECPECGRGFTLEELGIEEAELQAPPCQSRDA